MTKTPSTFDASPSALGYLYQLRYALLLALSEPSDSNRGICVEKLDDVTLHTEPAIGADIASSYQLKHHLTRRASLSNSSPDVWKTLRIWATAVATNVIDPYTVRLCLVTTSAPSSSHAIRLLVPDTAGRQASSAKATFEAVGARSKSKLVQEAYAKLATLSNHQRTALFNAIYLLPNSPDVLAVRQQLQEKLRFSVHPQHLAALVDHLEGWWFNRIIAMLMEPKPQVLWARLVLQRIHEIREQFRSDTLPEELLAVEVPDSAAPADDRRKFVRQLRLIQLGDQRIRLGQEDYWRTFEQRSRWLRAELLGMEEVESYESRLIDAWRTKAAIADEEVGEDCDEPALAAIGQRLYNWSQETAPASSSFQLRPSLQAPYIVRGSYHMLADGLRVGWHPHWKSRLPETTE